MKPVLFSLLLICSLLTACAANPQNEAPVQSTVLVEGTRSWDGGDFSYPQGNARMTVTRITMKAGASLPMHCHPVPLAGEVVNGPLEVRKENGETIIIPAGSGLIEVSNQWHYGHAIEDVEILVVYAGADGVPNTVFKDGDPQWLAACR